MGSGSFLLTDRQTNTRNYYIDTTDASDAIDFDYYIYILVKIYSIRSHKSIASEAQKLLWQKTTFMAIFDPFLTINGQKGTRSW